MKSKKQISHYLEKTKNLNNKQSLRFTKDFPFEI